MPYVSGQPIWCECGWIDAGWYSPPPEPAHDRRVAQVLRFVQDRVLREQTGRGRFLFLVLAPLVAALVSLVVLLAPFALLGWAVTIIQLPTENGAQLAVRTLFAIAVLVVVIVLFPVPRFRPSRSVAVSTMPELERLLSAVSRHLGAPEIHRVALGIEYNAAVTSWWRRNTVFLGLPLVACLDSSELAFVLGHEIGHLRRRRAATNWASDRAMNSLRKAYRRLTTLTNLIHGVPWFGMLTVVFLPARAICNLAAHGIRVFSWGAGLILELDCDRDGSTVAGTKAALAAECKIQLSAAVTIAARRCESSVNSDPYTEIRDAFRRPPMRTLEFGQMLAIRSAGVASDSIWDTHPASATRLGLVRQPVVMAGLPRLQQDDRALLEELDMAFAPLSAAWGAQLREGNRSFDLPGW